MSRLPMLVQLNLVLSAYCTPKRRGRHRTPVADLADDISHVCNFVSQDSSLPHTTERSATMPAHCSSHKPVILDVSSVPTMSSHTSLQVGTPQQMPSAHWGEYGLTSTYRTPIFLF